VGGREDHSHSSPSLSNSGMKKLPVSRKGRRKGVHGERKRERISKCTKGQKHIPPVANITSFPKPHHSFFRQHNFILQATTSCSGGRGNEAKS